MPRKSNKQDNKKIIIAIILISLVLLGLYTFWIYSWGKSNGHSQRTEELKEDQIEVGQERSRLSLWEGNLIQREQKLNTTQDNINNCNSILQNKTEKLRKCNIKLENTDQYEFFFPLYYSYNDVQIILFIVILFFPLSFTLLQLIIKDKKLKIAINWIAVIILALIILFIGIE